MNNNSNEYDLIIPVYNEKNIVKLLDYLNDNTKKLSNIFICYDDEDLTIKIIKNSKYSNAKNIFLIKNPYTGPCEAIKAGISKSTASAIIVYPADDYNNGFLLDKMYKFYSEGYDVVCPSRFIKGGLMKKCPLIKFLLVKIVSFLLFYLSNIKIKDPTNGFRLFSKKLIDEHQIESKTGFAYSLELLIKAKKNNLNIKEIPSIWIEREDRKSTFKIFKWSPQYLKWFFYALF